MHDTLPPSSILAAWEAGASRAPLDRALAVLWAAGAGGDDPAGLPVAERDRRLLAIRAGTFGPVMPALAQCPDCGTEMELDLNATDLAKALPDGGAITSRALAALVAGEASSGLFGSATLEDLEAEAQAVELTARLTCAECGAEWTETLDVAAHVWADVERGAMALMSDVAALAMAYGWTEAQVLALGPARRRAYLSLAGAA